MHITQFRRVRSILPPFRGVLEIGILCWWFFLWLLALLAPSASPILAQSKDERPERAGLTIPGTSLKAMLDSLGTDELCLGSQQDRLCVVDQRQVPIGRSNLPTGNVAVSLCYAEGEADRCGPGGPLPGWDYCNQLYECILLANTCANEGGTWGCNPGDICDVPPCISCVCVFPKRGEFPLTVDDPN